MSEREKGRWGAFAAIFAAALGILQFYRPASPAPTEPFAAIARARGLSAAPSLNAFGASQEVRLRFTLPSSLVEFPLEVSGDVTRLAYEWISADDTTRGSGLRAVSGASFVSPAAPGFYHLAIVRGTDRQIIAEPTLAVMVPFRAKIGATLNGYRIGTYIAERLAEHDHPLGFLQVNRADVDRRVSTHLRLGDFLTRDQEDVWPKYVALNPRLLDKLELVFARIGAQARFTRAATDSREVAFDVHSGFRTPAHNRGVWRAAGDSRHQYGDAADLAIDADGDGRITARDEALVLRAVDEVENEHPELVGGLGLYTSAAYNTPYVHIDARGSRSRWKG